MPLNAKVHNLFDKKTTKNIEFTGFHDWKKLAYKLLNNRVYIKYKI